MAVTQAPGSGQSIAADKAAAAQTSATPWYVSASEPVRRNNAPSATPAKSTAPASRTIPVGLTPHIHANGAPATVAASALKTPFRGPRYSVSRVISAAETDRTTGMGASTAARMISRYRRESSHCTKPAMNLLRCRGQYASVLIRIRQ